MLLTTERFLQPRIGFFFLFFSLSPVVFSRQCFSVYSGCPGMCSVDQANLISEILLPLPHEGYHYCLALIGLFNTGDINFFLASAYFTRIYGCILCVCVLTHAHSHGGQRLVPDVYHSLPYFKNIYLLLFCVCIRCVLAAGWR